MQGSWDFGFTETWLQGLRVQRFGLRVYRARVQGCLGLSGSIGLLWLVGLMVRTPRLRGWV